MSIIVISGVDGSGKTSVIENLQSTLERESYKTRYVWLRYNHYLTKFILAFCRFSGLTRYIHFENSRVVYHDFHCSRIVSWLFITTTFIDTFFTSLIKVYLPRLWSDTVIICDRWIYDIMVDLEVDTRVKFENDRFIKKIFMSLLPTDSVCYVISRDTEKVRKERDESLNDDNYPIRYALYQRHSTDGRLIVVDNNGSIDESVHQIREHLSLAGELQ